MKIFVVAGLMAAAAVASAQAVDVGMAVSGTANAGVQKVGEAVESVKGSYHDEMAKQDYDAAKKELNSGNIKDAIDDASSSLVHADEAKKAKGKAERHKKAASRAFHKAKVGAGVGVSASAGVK